MPTFITWVLAHQAMCAAAGVAVIDFFWAINPNLKSNGILHSIYTFLFSKETPAA